jgi:hypothetical protein
MSDMSAENGENKCKIKVITQQLPHNLMMKHWERKQLLAVGGEKKREKETS